MQDSDYTMRLLDIEEVKENWKAIRAMIENVRKSNDLVETAIDPTRTWEALQTGEEKAIGFFKSGQLKLVMLFEIVYQYDVKCANITVMAGKEFTKFFLAEGFWDKILKWFRAQGVVYVDAATNPRLAKILARRFGFNMACVAMRMKL